jgi:hypothetical protein
MFIIKCCELCISTTELEMSRCLPLVGQNDRLCEAELCEHSTVAASPYMPLTRASLNLSTGHSLPPLACLPACVPACSTAAGVVDSVQRTAAPIIDRVAEAVPAVGVAAEKVGLKV